MIKQQQNTFSSEIKEGPLITTKNLEPWSLECCLVSQVHRDSLDRKKVNTVCCKWKTLNENYEQLGFPY